MYLSQEELHEAQCLINSMSCGIYELKEIYGGQWAKVATHTTFGKKFKLSVDSNFLKNIQAVSKKSNNHWLYKIFFERKV